MLKIALLGDVALIGKYSVTQEEAFKRLEIIKEVLSEYDYVICNLEAPLTDNKKTLVCKSMHLRSDIANVQILKYLGISAVNLANNHMYDFGKRGLDDTIRILGDNNIEWFGVNGKTIHVGKDSNKICISGFCCLGTNGTGYARQIGEKGINLLSLKNIEKQISNDACQGEYSIINLHWGAENSHYPDVRNIKMAEKILAVKNDIVLCGHHPHVLQGTKKTRGGFLAYSLGNFLFDDCTSINGRITVEQQEMNKQGLLLELYFDDGRLIDSKMVGIHDEEEGIAIADYESLIDSINDSISNLPKEQYEYKRKAEREKTNLARMGKHDINWLRSHLNYYSIGARISMYARKYRFKKVLKEFGV